jgi:putative two-component system protein, hydrogenase maturation factor HypX/HoxX
MRILFLTRSFNSLAQRLFLALREAGHEVSLEYDISDAVTQEAVAQYQPALLIAPFLQRAIPAAVWQQLVCLVVHPGVVGDRGPSALDWAIQEGEADWGVTVLQATAAMDAGPVWAHEGFAMRQASKSSLYRREVSDAAVRAVLRAVQHFSQHGAQAPPPPPADPRGRWRPLMRQEDRRIDWQRDDTACVLRKIHAGDGTPGVRDELFHVPCALFDAHAEPDATHHAPGTLIARRDHAVLRATRDGAVWLGHVRRSDQPQAIKLPTTLAFAAEAAALPEWPLAIDADIDTSEGWREIRYEAHQGVGVLHFEAYNGALSTAQCERLTQALRWALAQPPPVLLLAGGSDFWCNGMHLNVIEAAPSAADASMQNIEAIDDLTLTLIEAREKLVIAALQGAAGAGGVFMALAADEVWAHPGVVLNAHYKNMGNLYGSEYWTYLLPRRLPAGATVADVMGPRLPLTAAAAARLGLVDAVFAEGAQDFLPQALERAAAIAASAELPARLAAKRAARERDEAAKPLAAYRAEELARMQRCFYGFDTSYHVARSNFVHRVLPSWTPRHLAVHRQGRLR